MFNWLRRKVMNAANDANREDMERFTRSLRGSSAQELGTVVALAAYLRVTLRDNGYLPDDALDGVSPMPGDQRGVVAIKLGGLIREFQAEKQFTDAAACMVWLHTVRACWQPELRLAGREMWAELARGAGHAEDAADFIESMGKPFPAQARAGLGTVPPYLAP